MCFGREYSRPASLFGEAAESCAKHCRRAMEDSTQSPDILSLLRTVPGRMLQIVCVASLFRSDFGARVPTSFWGWPKRERVGIVVSRISRATKVFFLLVT